MNREDSFQCGLVIMASGLGKRFGGNKLMADFCGRPLASEIMESTAGLFTACVVVTRSEAVAEVAWNSGIPSVIHDLPGRNDTVRLGLQFLLKQCPEMDACMFCLADQPLLKRETVLRMLEQARACPNKIWRMAWQGEPGSPVLFPEALFTELESLPEGKGGGVLCKRYPELVGIVEAEQSWELRDVDTRRDLEELLIIKQTAL